MRAIAVLALVVSASTPAQEPTMASNEENKAVVRKVFEQGVNEGKLELLDQLIGADYTPAAGPAGARGPAAFAAPLRALREAFPDIRYRLDEVIAEGDTVAAHWHWTGTQRNAFHGPGGTYAATNQVITNEGMGVFEVRNGKVHHAVVLTDRLGFLQEVGAAPRLPGR